MTDRELMQMALDALDSDCGATKFGASEALRTRLAQPEPQPVAWVAYENGEKHGIDFDEDEIAELPVGTMLYTAPPQREWQGLVIDEIEASASLGVYAKPLIEFARAIEAKLKAKNA